MHRNIVAALALALVTSARTTSAQQSDNAAIEKGRDLYEQHCMTCHGSNMVSPGTASYDLRRFPKDQQPRFLKSVTEGKAPGMPAWRGVVSPEEVAQLWAYVITGGK